MPQNLLKQSTPKGFLLFCQLNHAILKTVFTLSVTIGEFFSGIFGWKLIELPPRAQRQGVDKVEDNVQKHLYLEADTIKNSQVLLRQTQMQVGEEIRQLQKAKFTIEKDLEDKAAAMDIDQTTSNLKVRGPDKKQKKGGGGGNKYATPAHPNVYSPADWQEHSELNIAAAGLQGVYSMLWPLPRRCLTSWWRGELHFHISPIGM